MIIFPFARLCIYYQVIICILVERIGNHEPIFGLNSFHFSFISLSVQEESSCLFLIDTFNISLMLNLHLLSKLHMLSSASARPGGGKLLAWWYALVPWLVWFPGSPEQTRMLKFCTHFNWMCFYMGNMIWYSAIFLLLHFHVIFKLLWKQRKYILYLILFRAIFTFCEY